MMAEAKGPPRRIDDQHDRTGWPGRNKVGGRPVHLIVRRRRTHRVLGPAVGRREFPTHPSSPAHGSRSRLCWHENATSPQGVERAPCARISVCWA
eukprot:4185243-Prymnesium_polylepis.3